MTEVSSVPGTILLVLFLSVLATYPLSLLCVWLYRRAAERRTRDTLPLATRQRPVPDGVSTRFTGSAGALQAQLRDAPRRSAFVQGSAALVLAVYLTVLVLKFSDIELSVWRVLTLAMTLLWPGVLATFLTGGLVRKQRMTILVIAAVAYGLCGVAVSGAGAGTAAAQIATLWALLNLPFTIVLAAVMARHIRGIGPAVFLVIVLAFSGPAAAFQFLWRDPDTAMTLGQFLMFDVGLDPLASIGVLALAGGVAAVPCGLGLFRLLGAAYEHRRIGGEGITLSALWLIYITILAAFTLFFAGPMAVILGLAAFPLYLALVWVARRLFLKRESGPGPMLLLLRVFWDKGRTPTLFRVVSRHWRHVGPIAILGGKDLATSALELDEFMAFVRRDVLSLFVVDPASTIERLAVSSARRDPDGRFRCQQRWCYRETWKETVKGLMVRSAVVLVDGRSLGDKAAHLERIRSARDDTRDGRVEEGIDFELTTLQALNALGRCVLIHDGSGALEQRLEILGINPKSVTWMQLTGDESTDVATLLEELSRCCLTTARPENTGVAINATDAAPASVAQP